MRAAGRQVFDPVTPRVYPPPAGDDVIRLDTTVLHQGVLVILNGEVAIRPSTDADVTAMLAIYEQHIANGVGDLGDYRPETPDADDLKRRRKNMRKKRLPHLVADLNGTVAGYAYAVPFRKRPAYRYTLKHSIYVHPSFLHAGIGRKLLPALIAACAAGGYRQLIGYIDGANAASLRLHEACGFRIVGRLPSVGYKFGQWSDSVMVQCGLGDGDATQPDVATEPRTRDAPAEGG